MAVLTVVRMIQIPADISAGRIRKPPRGGWTSGHAVPADGRTAEERQGLEAERQRSRKAGKERQLNGRRCSSQERQQGCQWHCLNERRE